jgi:ATP-dependent DNA ligase
VCEDGVDDSRRARTKLSHLLDCGRVSRSSNASHNSSRSTILPAHNSSRSVIFGPDWLHGIKHDGFRIMALRDATGVRLYTRGGHDFTARFPLIVAAVTALPVRAYLIDGEAIVSDTAGSRCSS